MYCIADRIASPFNYKHGPQTPPARAPGAFPASSTSTPPSGTTSTKNLTIVTPSRGIRSPDPLTRTLSPGTTEMHSVASILSELIH